MRINAETKATLIRFGKVSLAAAGAVGFATIFIPMASEGVRASSQRSSADFTATGGANIDRVDGTNVYTISLRLSANQASSRSDVVSGALTRIAKANEGCEVSAPWQLPNTNTVPKQESEVYYAAVYCLGRPSRVVGPSGAVEE